MDNKTWIIISLVAILVIIGIYSFAKPSVTGNVVNTGSDKIVDTEKEEELSQASKVINEVENLKRENKKLNEDMTNVTEQLSKLSEYLPILRTIESSRKIIGILNKEMKKTPA